MPFSGLLSVVIPCYRSRAYLRETVAELVSFLEPHGEFEIVLVNDGSPDDVQTVIEALHAEDPRVRYVELGINQGQHFATLTGFCHTRGDVVLTVDDDGQNPPAAGLAVVEALQQRSLDVVYGRFKTTEQKLFRVLASRLNRWSSRYTLGNKLGVSISNVRAIRGQLARVLGAATSAHPYIDSLVFRATRRIAEVDVEHRSRGSGASTYSLRALFALWLAHLTTLSVVPLRLASAGSIAVSVAGFIIGVVQLARALIERRAPEGWISLFCTVTFLFSLLFAFLGIVGSYLGRLYVSQNSKGLEWIRGTSESVPTPSAQPAPSKVMS